MPHDNLTNSAGEAAFFVSPDIGRVKVAARLRKPDRGCGLGLPASNGLSHRAALPDPFADPRCAQLRDLQRRRRFCIKTQSRGDRACESYVAMALGAGGLPKGAREQVYKRAALLRSIVAHELAGNHDKADKALAKLTPSEVDTLAREQAVMALNEQTRQPWDRIRKDIEKEMRRIARTLPAWPFVESVAGASDLGLAVIVGEAGDPTAYRDKHNLFKRLGIGVVDGVRQGNPGPNASADDWTRHGLNKQRKAEMFTFFYDAMLRAQWRADIKDDEGEVIAPTHPIGPYGEAYQRYKAMYVERGHKYPDRVARRRMTQDFIRDVRNAWRVGLSKCADNGPSALAALHAAE